MGMFIYSVPLLLFFGSAAADDVGCGLTDVVDEAVVERLLGVEPAVAVAVRVDLLDRLAGLSRGDLGKALLHVEDEGRLGLDVGRRAAESTVRLVQQHPRVGGDVPL